MPRIERRDLPLCFQDLALAVVKDWDGQDTIDLFKAILRATGETDILVHRASWAAAGHAWKQESIGLDGFSLWQCQVCFAWTRCGSHPPPSPNCLVLSDNDRRLFDGYRPCIPKSESP